MQLSFREKLARFLRREDVAKRLVRQVLNRALNSPMLRITRSTKELQSAH